MFKNLIGVLSKAYRDLEALRGPHATDVEMIIADSSGSARIDLIASGYEWICPECDMPNMEIEATEHVTYWQCGKTFEANPPEHAMKD